MSRRAALWLIPALVAVHNLEEALTFGRYLPVVRERAPGVVRAMVERVTYAQMLAALAVATVVPLVVVLWAQARPASRAALWSALTVQAVMALNVVSHVAASLLVMRGYSPGVATAVLFNLPFSVYLFRRAAREGWVSRRALAATAPAALVVHGPGVAGLILLAGRLTR
jgi:hypothetical protein